MNTYLTCIYNKNLSLGILENARPHAFLNQLKSFQLDNLINKKVYRVKLNKLK